MPCKHQPNGQFEWRWIDGIPYYVCRCLVCGADIYLRGGKYVLVNQED